MRKGKMIYRFGIIVVVWAILFFNVSCSIFKKSYELSLSRERRRLLKCECSFDIHRIQKMKSMAREIDRKTDAIIIYEIQGSDDDGNVIVDMSFDSLIM